MREKRIIKSFEICEAFPRKMIKVLNKVRKNKAPFFYSPNYSLIEYFTKNSRS